MDKRKFVIAIDGPVASGKGTIASQLAKALNGFYLYTGAMYRCVALSGIMKGIDLHNEADVVALLPTLAVQFVHERIFLNGTDVTDRIKEKDTAEGSSVVAVFPKVRANLVAKQQEIAKEFIEKGMIVVSEGRDMGTVAFPDAALKIYLTASSEVRAHRRLVQYERLGRTVNLAQIMEELRVRDERDQNREADPLPSNPEELGYVILDNSAMNAEETVEAIKKELGKRELLND